MSFRLSAPARAALQRLAASHKVSYTAIVEQSVLAYTGMHELAEHDADNDDPSVDEVIHG